MVLVVSFVALAVLWPEPQLERRRLAAAARRARPRAHQPARSRSCAGRSASCCSGVVVYTGLAGAQSSTANFAPDLRLRDLLARAGALRACCSATSSGRSTRGARSAARSPGWPAGGPRPSCRRRWPTPSGSGSWPAAPGIFAFAALELVALERRPARERGHRDARSTRRVTFVAMALYGVEALDATAARPSPSTSTCSRASRPCETRDRRARAAPAAVRPRRTSSPPRGPCRCWR